MHLQMSICVCVIQRMQSPRTELFLNIVFIRLLLSLFPLLGAPHCKPLLVSISRFEMRILNFLLEMSFGPSSFHSAIIVFIVANCGFLSVGLATSISILPAFFNLHLAQTLQHVVSRSVSDCR